MKKTAEDAADIDRLTRECELWEIFAITHLNCSNALENQEMRDAAKSEVERLTKERDELRDANLELEANCESRLAEFQGQCAETVALRTELSQVIRERDRSQEVERGLRQQILLSTGLAAWGRFLGARAELIHDGANNGKSAASIAAWLSCDPGQVALIAATNLDDIIGTGRWYAKRHAATEATPDGAVAEEWKRE